MDWLLPTFIWYGYLFILGLIFFPLTKKLFFSFYDHGYAFAKTIAILILSYVIFVAGTLHILPFSQMSIFLIIILFCIGNVVFLIRPQTKKNHDNKTSFPIGIYIIEELLFIASLLFLTVVRGQEPSIRGLEKFMDFGFMNAILRSNYFPPLDMWLSADSVMPKGYPINYYYFGHLTGAFLIKLTNIKASIGYNLILASIMAQSMTLVFSLSSNLIYIAKRYLLKQEYLDYVSLVFYGLLGAFIVNLGGNLHTIYLFTSGYPNESPIPFWNIFANYNPTKYWYPNATRFIPFTIHEFPVYSYVVADLHGHVFDIPFVLLTLAILFLIFIRKITLPHQEKITSNKALNIKKSFLNIINSKYLILYAVLLGFLISVHYMTNAFDGPIYLLCAVGIFFMISGLSVEFVVLSALTFIFFIVFSLPFSAHFSPFVSGIGVNCSLPFLTDIKKFGPFLFEKGNCQASPPWMLFVLWGFFWINFGILLALVYKSRIFAFIKKQASSFKNNPFLPLDTFVLFLFAFGTFLIVIPEQFYIKDIYPAHFRANTMFKLGYQAFIMMGVASLYVFFRVSFVSFRNRIILKCTFLCIFMLIFLYPFFAFTSYYGTMQKPVQIDGDRWLKDTYPQDKELVDYINTNILGQPVILEAQGDSYTDFERISAYTGVPTVAGWWVHEWLWRGSSDVVGKRIPDVVDLYETKDIERTKELIKKYHIQYVVVSKMEKEKYKNLYEDKFSQVGSKIFTTSNNEGAIYQVN